MRKMVNAIIATFFGELSTVHITRCNNELCSVFQSHVTERFREGNVPTDAQADCYTKSVLDSAKSTLT